ncbi:MAG: FCD domain-containing protein [Actinomycetia bacterium]|nr:FCD domain-containing protein [Actinomycetes bacterium]
MLRRLKRATEVVAQIQERIRAERLGPGASLGTLKDLCRAYEVSLPTMRNALYLLQQDGTVVVRAGQQGGVFVARPEARPVVRAFRQLLVNDQVPLEDVLELRGVIEGEAARLAALRARPAEVAALEASVDHLRATVGELQSPFLEENLRFHGLVARASRNRLLYRMFQCVESLLYESTRVRYPIAVQEAVVAAHAKIVEAIAARDGARARGRMLAHLEAFARYRLEVAEAQPWPPEEIPDTPWIDTAP